MKEKGVSGWSMCKGLKLREHGMSETIFNSAKLKKTVGWGWGAKLMLERKAGWGTDSKGRPGYLPFSPSIPGLWYLPPHLLLNLDHLFAD